MGAITETSGDIGLFNPCWNDDSAEVGISLGWGGITEDVLATKVRADAGLEAKPICNGSCLGGNCTETGCNVAGNLGKASCFEARGWL